jgi:4'-phosphopantetheinyl transferase
MLRGMGKKLGSARQMTATPDVRAKTAELWLVDLARSGPILQRLERELPRLGAAERGFVLARTDAERRLGAHVALRVLLERLSGDTARGKDFVRLAGGKPSLEGHGHDVAFSLSHADDLALIGLARGSPIGVDLEGVRAVTLSAARRQQILKAAAALAPVPLLAAPADATFVQAWVRLEALAKASGAGLARTLTALGVWHGPISGADVAALARRHLLRSGLKVHDLALRPGSIGAVAIAAQLDPPVPRSFPVDRAGIDALIGAPST